MYTSMEKCHYGNKVIFKSPGGGVLYAGGVTRGLKLPDNLETICIDMRAINRIVNTSPLRSLSEYTPAYNFINLPIIDMHIPTWQDDFWLDLAVDLETWLNYGKDVLVYCDGGHGRTGLFLSIIVGMWDICGGINLRHSFIASSNYGGEGLGKRLV
jgi:hypothetical protein